MKPRSRTALALAAIVISAAPLRLSFQGGPSSEPWPTLLSSQQSAIEHDVAVLHLRATMTLDRLVQAARSQGQLL
jgi:hypothetical protein